jgi:hypothetical protein
MGRKHIGDFIPAGVEVTVQLPNGKFVRHRVKEAVPIIPHNDAYEADPLNKEAPYVKRTNYKGYPLWYVYEANFIASEFEYFCDCGGKGTLEHGFYGPSRGQVWRVRCCKVCPYTPKRGK